MKFDAYVGDTVIGKKRVLLLKPLTYMNLSGKAVGAAANFYKISPENILGMYDDVSLNPATVRIRRKGSAGGHNGIKDIIEVLGSDNFPRIKIGVGAKPHPDYDLAKWVLGKFGKEDSEKMKASAENAADCIKLMVQGKTDEAMNKFNS